MFWELWHGNSWRGDWQGEFLKGRVRFLFGDVLSHYFFFFEKHAMFLL